MQYHKCCSTVFSRSEKFGIWKNWYSNMCITLQFIILFILTIWSTFSYSIFVRLEPKNKERKEQIFINNIYTSKFKSCLKLCFIFYRTPFYFILVFLIHHKCRLYDVTIPHVKVMRVLKKNLLIAKTNCNLNIF